MDRFRWPQSYRCAVALTFDLDGECIPFIVDPDRARNRLTLQSEAAFGPFVGMPRIMRLLATYQIPATVFVPGFTAQRHPDLLKELVEQEHEIGHHGYLHERPDTLSALEEEQVLLRGSEVLHTITGVKPRGYRSPSWELKPGSPALLKRHGFLYDSSLMGNDIPSLLPTGEGEALVEIPVQWMLDDFCYFNHFGGQVIASCEHVLACWREEFEGMYDEGGCFVLTMHPFLMGRASRVRLLEHLIRFIRGFPGVWWATCGHIADYCVEQQVCQLHPVLDLGEG